MAEEVRVIDASNKKVHPFFFPAKALPRHTNENVVMPITPESSCGSTSDKVLENMDDNAGHTAEGANDTLNPNLEERRRKRRKTEPISVNSKPTTQSGRQRGRPRKSAGANILNHLKPKEDSSAGAPLSVESTDGPAFALDPNPTEAPNPATAPEIVPTPPSATVANNTETAPEPTQSTSSPPKKLLKFNPKTGTIGSPPKPQLPIMADVVPKKRGRKPKRFVVPLRYGEDLESRMRIGRKIDAILGDMNETASMAKDVQSAETDGRERSQPETPKKVSPNRSSNKKAKPITPTKPTHPFFLNKNEQGTEATIREKKDAVEKPPKRQTIFTSTPCSPRKFQPTSQKTNLPQFGQKSGGLKIPGAKHPAWPWKGVSHVRGDDQSLHLSVNGNAVLPTGRRKAKRRAVEVGMMESVLQQAGAHLDISSLARQLEDLNADDFQPPNPLLRIPTRHFESGKWLQARVAPHLHTRANTSKVHPAISQAYDSLRSTLSAFDRATCESSTWAQKYAPLSASQVLQNGREAELLRDWLATLKVQAVDTGLADGSKTKPVSGPPKRGRKKQKLDGFVVSSDEEEMDEISEAEDGWAPSTNSRTSQKTVVKLAPKGGSRLTNAVLLSGPHGCGKTATVYAIAKELDFEVFELSPGSRRNGKDIIEKVGDMTRNHLVQHQQKGDAPTADDTDEQLTQDLKSGKQGMMTNFFKPNTSTQTLKPKKRSKTHTNQQQVPQESGVAAAKSQKQKQSLILLEEVDVLYDEDKQFWATIISMISQSKRPFIMTCNDENLVPIQSLTLHGIFRFSQPSKELAVDRLILIAANEGHLLSRHAIETLYDSRNQDLRASINELNYWCQFGVGDPRGGFDWFYRRWPEGSDVDEEGNTIRVISEGTYQTGMGWLGRDAVTSTSSSRSIEEELQQQTWHNWSLDLCSSGQSEIFANATPGESSPQGRLALLKAFDEYSSQLSDADLCSSGAFAELNEVKMDTSLPALPSKIREDFVIGQQVLEVSPLSRYDTVSADISTTMRIYARSQLRNLEQFPNQDSRAIPRPLCEPQALLAIEQGFKDRLEPDPTITRFDYSVAFDPLATSEKTMAGGYLDPSVFDRTTKLITLDVAPYIRSIVSYDQQLQKERLLRSNLISEGGTVGKKRMRNTRSAYSAMEGGSRASTRREKYFSADINPHLVMQTGGDGWGALTARTPEEQTTARNSRPSSIGSVDENSD